MKAKDLGWRQFDPFLTDGRFQLVFDNDDKWGPVIGLLNHAGDTERYEWWVWTGDKDANLRTLTSRIEWLGENEH